MARENKRLAAMRGNPKGDWRIEDVEAVCAACGIDCRAPKRGSHHTVSHESQPGILTIPSRRPIKPVYIRQLAAYIDKVLSGETDGSA